MNKTVYTIGYSSYELADFVQTLKDYKINAVVDVRSSPYSQYKSDFNRENLKQVLQENDIAYVFLGKECGARVDDLSCYVDGKVNYDLVAKADLFQDGLKRILDGTEKFSLALMCAEKDPITCHRTILVCRNLLSYDVSVKHFLSNGQIEVHEDSEKRLLEVFKLHHPDLFRSEQERLNEAYSRQGEKIAYESANPEEKNEVN